MLILKALFNFLSGGVLEKVLGHFERKETQRIESMSEVQRQIYADTAHQRETAKQVRIATAGFWELRVLTALVLGIFVVHILLVGLDTCFGLGWAINKFPAPFDEWEGAIILSLFGLGTANRAVSSITAALIARK